MKGILVVLLFALTLMGFGFVTGRDFEKDRQEATTIASLRESLATTERHLSSVQEIAAKQSKARAKVRTITKEIIREVPIRIPADSPPLPGGFRVLHDAAAAGTQVDSSAPGGTDATPVPPQAAAETIAENYGEYHDLAERHRGLQDYVRQVCH